MNFHCCNKTPNFLISQCAWFDKKNLLKFLKAFLSQAREYEFYERKTPKKF